MEVFDEMNLNPLIVIEDNEEGKRLPNEKDPPQDNLDDSKKTDSKKDPKNQPILDELEVDIDNEGRKDLNDDNAGQHKTDVTDDVSDDSVKQWVDYYSEMGLLSKEKADAFKGSHEDLTNLILEEDVDRITNGIEEYKNSVPSLVKEILNAWEEGAEEDVLKRVIAVKVEQIQLSKINEVEFKADKDLQKKVLTSYLQKTTRMTDAKIQKHVERLSELEELEDDALEALTQSKVLLKQEEDYIRESTKKENLEREKQIVENQTKLKDTIKGTKEIITNIALTEGEKKDIESMIFQPVGRYQNGAPQYYLQKLYDEDPTGMTVKMNYLALVTKGFTDWSKIEKKAVTTATKNVDSVFKTAPPKGTSQKAATDNSDWRSNLKSFNKTIKK